MQKYPSTKRTPSTIHHPPGAVEPPQSLADALLHEVQVAHRADEDEEEDEEEEEKKRSIGDGRRWTKQKRSRRNFSPSLHLTKAQASLRRANPTQVTYHALLPYHLTFLPCLLEPKPLPKIKEKKTTISTRSPVPLLRNANASTTKLM